MSKPSPYDLLPVRPVIFEILLLLNVENRHGYGIMQELKSHSSGKFILDPGTLYRTLQEMERAELIATTKRSERRRYYEITPFGRRVASAEAERMAALVRTATRGNLLGSKKS